MRGTTRCFPRVLEEQTAYLTQSVSSYNEANRHGASAAYCSGPRSRREIQDAPAPDRVLDGRPEMAYADLNDVMALARISSYRSSRVCSTSGGAS